jgi:hypothetical protein
LKPIIFPKSGKIMLASYTATGALQLTAANITTAGGTVQKIESSINIKTTELPDGNSDWAMGEYDVGKSGEIKVTLSSYQPAIYARLVGSTAVDVTSEDFWAVEEEQTIPSSGTYAVVLNNTIKTGGTIVIADAAGSPFVSTGSGPASGQFTVAGASVTFNSADAGKEVLVTYQWVAPTATKVELPDASTRPQLYCVVSGEATDEDETTTYSTQIIVDKCKATGDLNPPPQQRDPQPWSFTLKVLKPRAGQKAVSHKYSKR